MAKKSFDLKENPAIQFISSAECSSEEHCNSIKADTINAESKSRRVQLLIRPSLYVKLKKMADNHGISVNEMINQILTSAL